MTRETRRGICPFVWQRRAALGGYVLVDKVLEVSVADLEGLAAGGDAEGGGTEEHGHGGLEW